MTKKKYFVFIMIIILGSIFTKFMSRYLVGFVNSGSMLPTIKVNYAVLIEKDTYVDYGDIFAFNRENTIYIKRLIAKENDTVNIIYGKVMVNGIELDEPYVSNNDNFYGNFIVPEGKVFALGDNRKISNDSRYDIGFIGVEEIVGVRIR